MRQAKEGSQEDGEHRRLPAEERTDHPQERDIAEAHGLPAENEPEALADGLGQARPDKDTRHTDPEPLEMGHPDPGSRLEPDLRPEGSHRNPDDHAGPG